MGSIDDVHGHLRPFTPPKRDGVTPVTLGPFRRDSPYLLDDPRKLLSPDSKVTARGGRLVTHLGRCRRCGQASPQRRAPPQTAYCSEAGRWRARLRSRVILDFHFRRDRRVAAAAHATPTSGGVVRSGSIAPGPGGPMPDLVAARSAPHHAATTSIEGRRASEDLVADGRRMNPPATMSMRGSRGRGSCGGAGSAFPRSAPPVHKINLTWAGKPGP